MKTGFKHKEFFFEISARQRQVLLQCYDLFDDHSVYRRIVLAVAYGNVYHVLMSNIYLDELEALAIEVIQQSSCLSDIAVMEDLVDNIYLKQQNFFSDLAYGIQPDTKSGSDRVSGLCRSKIVNNDSWQPYNKDGSIQGYCYDFLVELSPDIWRLIAIPANFTLNELHMKIVDEFSRSNSSLYSFFYPVCDSNLEDMNSIMRNSVEFTHSHCCNQLPQGTQVFDAGQIEVSQVGLKPKDILWYLFDYEDQWLGKITTIAFYKAQECLADIRV